MALNVFTSSNFEKLPSNLFDLTHDRKMSVNMGGLYPILVHECVPGDTTKIQSSSMLRFAPLVAPVMHRASVYMHFFFVPNRLVWPNWEGFITGGEQGDNTSVAPYIEAEHTDWIVGRLGDYMGVPTSSETETGADIKVSAIPFAAYNKIFNEYYRDQNLMDPILDELIDGNNSNVGGTGVGFTALTDIQKRAWQHDYLTSALPFTQKGDEVTLPLGTTAPLEPTAGGDQMRFVDNAGTFINGALSAITSTSGTPNGDGTLAANAGAGNLQGYVKVNDVYEVDLSAATASSIIELRRAFKLQEWLEKNARGGSRYIESMLVHFGVRSSDQRLQRPEYLGGHAAPIKISEVLQTSETNSSVTPQGNMAGHAISVGQGKPVTHYAEEHGYIIGLMSVMPKTAYQNGIPRHLTRFDKYDYYWPTFAHIGEQGILNKEVYVSADADEQDEVWGYTPRYSEYKFINDSVHGDFRTSLGFWHMGRKFANLPPLNNDFIQMDFLEVNRIFAVQGQPNANLWAHVLNEVKAKRKMPVFGNPKL